MAKNIRLCRFTMRKLVLQLKAMKAFLEKWLSLSKNSDLRQYRTKIVRQMRRQIFRQMKQKFAGCSGATDKNFFEIWRKRCKRVCHSGFARWCLIQTTSQSSSPATFFMAFPFMTFSVSICAFRLSWGVKKDAESSKADRRRTKVRRGRLSTRETEI